MKIVVETDRHPKIKVELDIYSLTYELARGAFLMHVAPPGIIYNNRPYKPSYMTFEFDKLFIHFEDKLEADAFIDWVKKTSTQVHKSFANMLD